MAYVLGVFCTIGYNVARNCIVNSKRKKEVEKTYNEIISSLGSGKLDDIEAKKIFCICQLVGNAPRMDEIKTCDSAVKEIYSNLYPLVLKAKYNGLDIPLEDEYVKKKLLVEIKSRKR